MYSTSWDIEPEAWLRILKQKVDCLVEWLMGSADFANKESPLEEFKIPLNYQFNLFLRLVLYTIILCYKFLLSSLMPMLTEIWSYEIHVLLDPSNYHLRCISWLMNQRSYLDERERPLMIYQFNDFSFQGMVIDHQNWFLCLCKSWELMGSNRVKWTTITIPE